MGGDQQSVHIFEREVISDLAQLASWIVSGEVAVHCLAEVFSLGPAHWGRCVQEGSVRLLQEIEIFSKSTKFWLTSRYGEWEGTRVDRAHPLLALAWPGPGILSAWGRINIGSNWGNIKLDKPSLQQIIRDETHLKYIFCDFLLSSQHFLRIKDAQAVFWVNLVSRHKTSASINGTVSSASSVFFTLVSLADEWGLVAFHIKGLLEQLCCIMLVDLAQVTFQVFKCASTLQPFRISLSPSTESRTLVP